jgi:predicted transcriptional regulator
MDKTMRISAEPSQIRLEKPSPCNFTKEEIDQLAEQTANELGFTPGASVPGVIEGLGGEIKYVHASEWLETENGSIEVYGPGKFAIYLSRFTSRVRDQFTLAHELGHYVLHADFGSKRIRVARHGSNRVEWEANWFAAGFLMPRKKFLEMFRRHSDPRTLAARFDVSIPAASIRIESLGLK